MTDTDLVIATQKEFEDFLRHTLDATGKTFAELILSVRNRVPRSLIDDLHYVRRERNGLAHREKSALDNRRLFDEISARARESLRRVAVPIGSDLGYLIINKKSGKCLDVPWNMDSYAVHQWDCHRGLNQQWMLRTLGGDTVALVSTHTGRCLDVAHASRDNNAPVTQWKYEGGPNQRWIITRLEDYSYQIRAEHSAKVLDIVWGSGDDGATTIQYDWHGGENQRWWIGPALS